MSRLHPGQIILTVIFALASALVATSSLQAQPVSPVRSTAETYLAAYAALEYETMHGLYAEDAVFLDPTSFDIVQDRIEWQGADAIITGIQGWGLAAIDYQIQRTYEASGQVIFEAVADVTYGEAYNNRVFRYNIVTVLTVQDGQITEHRDYTDFAGATEITEEG